MRRAPILFVALSMSCAARPERAPAAPPEEPTAETEDVSTIPVPATTSVGTPPLVQVDEPTQSTFQCQVNTDAPEVRAHLGLEDMGPTGSAVRLPRTSGFLRFEHGADEYVGYVCETWSADSDECDGSVVQVVELAILRGDSTEVVWQSAPRLGGGNLACGRLSGNMFMQLALEDYDGDGMPDLSFGETHPTRPQSTVRLFSGARYRAMLPVETESIPDFDLCRPAPALEFSAARGGEDDFRPAQGLGTPIRAALVEGYLHSAECPDAE